MHKEFCDSCGQPARFHEEARWGNGDDLCVECALERGHSSNGRVEATLFSVAHAIDAFRWARVSDDRILKAVADLLYAPQDEGEIHGDHVFDALAGMIGNRPREDWRRLFTPIETLEVPA